MLYVGIDWATNSHTVTLLAGPGDVLAVMTIENTLKGFLRLLEAIREHLGEGQPAAESKDVLFAIEDRNQHLVDFLMANDFTGYLIEPNRMKGYRLRYGSSGNKTDPADSFILADVLYRDQDQLAPIVPDSETVRALKVLLRDRESFVRDQTRLINRLTICLRQYYPEALEFFSDVSGKTSLAFLEAYPDFAAARRLSHKRIEQFLAEHRCSRTAVLERIAAVLNRRPMPVPAVVVRVKRQQALHIIRQLRALQDAVVEYDVEIQRLGAENDEIRRFRGLPGGGTIISAGLHTLFGDDRTRFASAMEVQSLVGTAPKTIQSGNWRGVCFRFSCNRFYRSLAQRLALSATRLSGWAKRYYKGKRAEGKTHQHALRCLANLLPVSYTHLRAHET